MLRNEKKIQLVVLLLTVVFMSCQNKRSLDEQHLNMYFLEKHKINIFDYKEGFIIVISGNCGSCTEKTIKFLSQLGNYKNKRFKDFKKLVIVPVNNAYVLDSVRNSTIQFIVDEGFELDKYGVNFPRNTIFEFKDGNLVYKDFLYLDNVDTVAKKYGFRLQ